MKIKAHIETEIEVTSIRVEMAVSYGEEDIPNDFPLRTGDMWKATIDLDGGKIHNWPEGKSGRVQMKVCDCGSYYLLDKYGKTVAKIEEDYVPNDVIPGEYGDYCDLKINEQGIITNWPKYPDVSAFFKSED